jgi:hypothetical protein
VLVTVFLSIIDYKKSNIKTGKIECFTLSTNEVFYHISKFIFKTDLVKKHTDIDAFAEHFSNFDYGMIVRFFERKTINIRLSTNELIKDKKVRNFRKNYLALASIDDKNENNVFGITAMHSVFKLDKDCDNLPQPQKAINSYVCKGEWESIQIIVVPFTDTLKQLEISIANAPFPAKNMQCFVGEYAYCRKNKFPAEKLQTGWIADPLIPMDCDSSTGKIQFTSSIISTKIPKGETKALWFNYYIPENTKPGLYPITITISATCNGNRDEQTTRLNLKVLNYILPKTMHLKNAFSFSTDAIKTQYNTRDISNTKLKEYYRFLLDYHLNPMSLYDPIGSPLPAIDDWQWCIDRGANYFNIGYLPEISPDSIQVLKTFREKLSKSLTNLASHKLMDYTFIYGFDEVRKLHFPQLRFMYKQLRKVNKEIPFACTIEPNKKVSGSVDIWIPEIESYKENTKLFTTKEKIWEYVCYTNKDEYPNFYMEYPAIDPRIVFWHCSKNKLEGFLYYCVNNWIMFDTPLELQAEYRTLLGRIPKNEIWPDFPWIGHSFRVNDGQRFVTGDGQLVYPGKNMELYPSLRLVNIRDGIEDYECFYQLKQWLQTYLKKGNKGKAYQIKAFLDNVYQWTPSTQDDKKNPDELIAFMKEARYLLEDCAKE